MYNSAHAERVSGMGASCGWRGYQPSLVSPKRPPQLAASFVCGDARCQLFAFNIFRFGDIFGGRFSQLCLRLVITDILGAAIGSTDQATDGGLPDAAQPLAAS